MSQTADVTTEIKADIEEINAHISTIMRMLVFLIAINIVYLTIAVGRVARYF